MKHHLVMFIRGLLMGFADIIPGVSGGTMAFITGIYTRLITSLKELGVFLRILWQKLTKRSKDKLWRHVDFSLFIPLCLGIIVAFWLGAGLLHALLEGHAGETYSFFVGLILASAYMIYRHIKKHTVIGVFWGIIGLFAGLLLTNVSSPLNGTPNLLSVFILGIIAICAMLLPGISGSYILLMFGHYEFMLDSIRSLSWPYLLVFGLGAFIGLLGFSRILFTLLKKHKTSTFYALVGLMLGALTVPVMTAIQVESVVQGVLFFILGIVVVVAIEFIAKKKS